MWRTCVRVYTGLTLWCCMMAVAFRLADIFSSPGCPLCPPFAEREISASPDSIRLSASVLLSPPGLSVLRSSVCFSLLLASHKRLPEGTERRSRGTQKRGGSGARVDNDGRAHAMMSVLSFSFSRPPPVLPRFLFYLLSSLPLNSFLWHAEEARRK